MSDGKRTLDDFLYEWRKVKQMSECLEKECRKMKCPTCSQKFMHPDMIAKCAVCGTVVCQGPLCCEQVGEEDDEKFMCHGCIGKVRN